MTDSLTVRGHDGAPASGARRVVTYVLARSVPPGASSLMVHSSAPSSRVALFTIQSRIDCSSVCSATTAQSSAMNSNSPSGNSPADPDDGLPGFTSDVLPGGSPAGGDSSLV